MAEKITSETRSAIFLKTGSGDKLEFDNLWSEGKDYRVEWSGEGDVRRSVAIKPSKKEAENLTEGLFYISIFFLRKEGILGKVKDPYLDKIEEKGRKLLKATVG